MGYRSDVRCAIYGTKEIIETIKAAEKLKDEGDVLELFKEYITEWDTPTGDAYLYLKYDDVKWYDSYEDVIAWTKFMDSIIELIGDDDTNVGDLCMEFVRIGEENGDIDEDYYGNANYHLRAVTSIDSEIG